MHISILPIKAPLNLSEGGGVQGEGGAIDCCTA